MALPPADRAILQVLQTDGRISNQDLADRTNMSTSSCWRRVQSLEADGIVSGYQARVNADRVGLGFSAIVMVSLARHEAEEVAAFNRAVRNRPEVLQSFSITGDADFALRVVAADMAAYNAFLTSFLFRQPCVVKVNTHVVMDTVKDGTALPL